MKTLSADETREFMRPTGSLLEAGLAAFSSDYVRTGMTIAEIGCAAGASTAILAFALHGMGKLICVDAWEYDLPGFDDIDWPNGVAEAEFDAVAAQFPVIDKRKGWSVDVAQTIPDASLDLVYIDADHAYENVKADILAWRPKVKPGGIIAGHDFDGSNLGVIMAVTELLPHFHAIYPDSTWVANNNADR